MKNEKLSLIQNTNPETSHGNVSGNTENYSVECSMKEVFDKNHKVLFDASSDGILLITLKPGNLVYCNQTICKMLGYSLEELFQLSITGIFTKDFLIKSKDILDSIKPNESRILLNIQCVRKNGSVLFVDLKVLGIELDGMIYHLLSFSDITAKILYEDALKESEERWKFAIDGSDLGLWDWYTGNNKVFFSKKYKEMLGYKDDEIGETLDEWTKRIHPDDIERCFKDLDDHFHKRTEYYSNEHRILCKNGEYKWIHDRGKVIHWSDDGRPLRIIGTHSDISDRKDAEKKNQVITSRKRYFTERNSS
jgi:PAS domain S-box-containing protein